MVTLVRLQATSEEVTEVVEVLPITTALLISAEEDPCNNKQVVMVEDRLTRVSHHAMTTHQREDIKDIPQALDSCHRHKEAHVVATVPTKCRGLVVVKVTTATRDSHLSKQPL